MTDSPHPEEVAGELLARTTDPEAQEKILRSYSPLFHNEAGNVQLQPLVSGAILERLQFDGDAPELRSGPLPEGALPAVGVDTDATSLVVVGQQLEEASLATGEEAEAHRRALLSEVESGSKELTVLEGSSSDLATYKRGQLPPNRNIAPLPAPQLALMTAAEKSKLTFKAFATTQGRRSMLPVITTMLTKELTDKGLHVVSGDKPQDPPIYKEWVATISGEKAISGNFSIVDVAVKVIAKGLLVQAKQADLAEARLHVGTVNRYSDREVGWYASLS